HCAALMSVFLSYTTLFRIVIAYAYIAEHVFHLPIFYVEYSGTYGDPALVQKVKNELDNTLLFYGGGIENPIQAREMEEHADVVIELKSTRLNSSHVSI